jgi:2-amino-4-hydroxy-6-hydroxymethyldihydropteridine diphosphokinase
MPSPETVYIGLGSNLGDRETFLRQAVERMSDLDGAELAAVSPLYLTQPRDMAPGAPPFLNQVVKIEYSYSPEKLLEALRDIETEFGRTTKGDFKSRTLDLDILLFGDRIVKSADLEIPHPRLEARPFVLIPLLDIEPHLIHPATGCRLSDLVARQDCQDVELYRDHIARQV